MSSGEREVVTVQEDFKKRQRERESELSIWFTPGRKRVLAAHAQT
jgi:hypothetical protein